MKKIFNIALTALIALGFTACDDDDDVFYGIPSVNPQQPIMPADGITATDIVADGGTVDLDAVKTDGYIDMLDITRLENFPAGQQLKVVMNVSATADMAASQAIDLNVIDGTAAGVIKVAQAPALAWNEAFNTLVSRDPSAKTMYVNYVAYAVQGTTTVLLGSVGTPQAVSVVPFSPEHPVETEYYIYGTISQDQISSAVKLSHEGNQYDNPVFSTKINVTSADIEANGGWKFKVIPQTTFAAGQTWEQNHSAVFIGAGRREGTLAYSTDEADCEWIVIDKPGEYMLNVNVLDQTWELSNAIEYVYVVGNGNGWSWSTRLFTSDYINYQGFAFLNGEFKFTGTAGWNNDLGNYGAGATNYELLNGSNTNFQLDGNPGLYLINLNLPGLTYKKTLISSVGVVGSCNGWNAGAPIEMSPSDDYLTWEAEVTLTDTYEFKFCMNHGWDINLGGAEDDLQFNSPQNLYSPGAGTYLFVLDLSALPYQCYLEQQ